MIEPCDYDFNVYDKAENHLNLLCDNSYKVFCELFEKIAPQLKAEYKSLDDEVGFENARETLESAFYDTLF